MLKKRLIFTLLFDGGYFVLSRNFRLQKVGDLDWIKNNYNFSRTSKFIDELIILNVSREEKHHNLFFDYLRELASETFVPISVGGGVRSLSHAKDLLRSGADKIVINSLFENESEMINDLAKEFGQQCLVASVDVKKSENGKYTVFFESGTKASQKDFSYWMRLFKEAPIGEVYLNSIDQDGTGNGYDINLLKNIPANFTKPLILAGGAGNSKHLIEGLNIDIVDAVATAHLFNFIGDGLKEARTKILDAGISLPIWDIANV
jgi:cyclase